MALAHHVHPEAEQGGEPNVTRVIADQLPGQQSQTGADDVHRDLGTRERDADAELMVPANAAYADAYADCEDVQRQRQRHDRKP